MRTGGQILLHQLHELPLLLWRHAAHPLRLWWCGYVEAHVQQPTSAIASSSSMGSALPSLAPLIACDVHACRGAPTCHASCRQDVFTCVGGRTRVVVPKPR